MYKVVLGLASGEYSMAKKEEKVLTGNAEIDNEPPADYQDGIRPQLFKSLIGEGSQDFTGTQQQDAREYYSWILEKMMKGEKQAGTS